MCESFRPFLQLIRSGAIKSSSFSFDASIRSDSDTNDLFHRHFCFPTHQKFLEYLSNELLPAFGACRRYKFDVAFRKDSKYAKNVFVSLLGLPAVERSSNVEMVFRLAGDKLPPEAISHWLNFNHPNDGEGKGKERLLSIENYAVPNFEEIIEHLKKVNYIFVRNCKLNCSQHSVFFSLLVR